MTDILKSTLATLASDENNTTTKTVTEQYALIIGLATLGTILLIIIIVALVIVVVKIVRKSRSRQRVDIERKENTERQEDKKEDISSIPMELIYGKKLSSIEEDQSAVADRDGLQTVKSLTDSLNSKSAKPFDKKSKADYEFSKKSEDLSVIRNTERSVSLPSCSKSPPDSKRKEKDDDSESSEAYNYTPLIIL